mmetsp:Transcript_137004/g.292628  ORF Transcript_137004/g.292628 Transcript_137004/m.292628 type:complete len:201 (+) Transcript_137004:338-940(+)
MAPAQRKVGKEHTQLAMVSVATAGLEAWTPTTRPAAARRRSKRRNSVVQITPPAILPAALFATFPRWGPSSMTWSSANLASTRAPRSVASMATHVTFATSRTRRRTGPDHARPRGRSASRSWPCWTPLALPTPSSSSRPPSVWPARAPTCAPFCRASTKSSCGRRRETSQVARRARSPKRRARPRDSLSHCRRAIWHQAQ